MDKKMRSPLAKILVHADGLGAPTPETVRARAQELARIRGHRAYDHEDWQNARAELHGSSDDDAADEMGAFMASEADMVAVDVGRHTSRVPLEDERNLVEELYQEGLAEAEHDRMYLAALADGAAEAEEMDGDESGSWR